MNARKAAPTLGIAACLAVLAVLVWPYAVESAESVGAYYASGAITPLAAGLFALVSVIVFAAGREGRSDPATVAGVVLVFGLFIVLITVAFAFTARVDVLGGSSPFISWQRWLLVATGVLVLLSGGWYARSLRLL
jgi:hypothetical protein